MILQRLDEFLHLKNISYYQLENSVNASRGSISRAVKHGKNIGSNVLEKIVENYPDLNIEWLMTGKGQVLKNSDELLHETTGKYVLRTDNTHELQAIPLYNLEATAGLVELFQHYDENKPIDFLSIPNLPKCDGAVFVTGDSMYPLLKSGDIVVYKQVHNIDDGLFWGEMYLVAIDVDGDEYISVKYIQKSEVGDDHIKLVSQNNHHQPRDVRKDRIRALAMVKASVRINAMK